MKIKQLATAIFAILLSTAVFAAPPPSGSPDQLEPTQVTQIDQVAGTESANCGDQQYEAFSGELLIAQGCCRVCTTGKACGDSCISRSYQCHQPPGCACNG